MAGIDEIYGRDLRLRLHDVFNCEQVSHWTAFAFHRLAKLPLIEPVPIRKNELFHLVEVYARDVGTYLHKYRGHAAYLEQTPLQDGNSLWPSLAEAGHVTSHGISCL